MRCPSVRRKLMAYHDGELGRAMTGRIGKHLARCRGCAGLLEALERGDDFAGGSGFPDPGQAYWETFTGKVMEKVRKEARTGPSEPRTAPARAGFSPVRLAPALSVALVVLVAAGVLMKVQRSPVLKSPFPSGEKVVEKEIPSTFADHLRTLPESKGVSLPSTPNEAVQAGEAPERVSSEERKRSITGETPEASLGKKEAKATPIPGFSDGERVAVPARDMDGSSVTALPGQEAQAVPRFFKAVPHQEAGLDAGSAVDEGETPIPVGVPDDGSWGQLQFARQLADQGKNRESEEVLHDLLERNSQPPIQEEASLLLVAVLDRQSRVPEARKVLEDVQRLYPANKAIQNYRLGEE